MAHLTVCSSIVSILYLFLIRVHLVAVESIYEEYNHVLTGVGVSLVISGSESRERVKAMQSRFEEMGSVGPPLHFVQGINGNKLRLTENSSHSNEIMLVEESLGLKVLLWDWRDSPHGLGGPGMNTPTVSRITGCALSHIYAARQALLLNKWPALVLEDDIVFGALMKRTGRKILEEILIDVGKKDWGLIQVGYLLPSAHAAATGLLDYIETNVSVRRRDACSVDHKMVGIQGYLLSEKGARALLDRYWPGGSEGIEREGEIIIDLRPAVNLAADYLIFNAMAHELPSYITWRPWLLEDRETSAMSSLFPGTVKQASHDTAVLTQLVLEESQNLPRHFYNPRREGTIQKPPRRGKVADWVLWGDELVSMSHVHTKEQMKHLLGICPIQSECSNQPLTLASAVLNQCFTVCHRLESPYEDTVSLLLPGTMQCWRVSLTKHELNQLKLSSHNLVYKCAEWGLEKEPGTCDTLLQAFISIMMKEDEHVISFHPNPSTFIHEYDELFQRFVDPFSQVIVHEKKDVATMIASSGSSQAMLKQLVSTYRALGNNNTADLMAQISRIHDESCTGFKGGWRTTGHLLLSSDLQLH